MREIFLTSSVLIVIIALLRYFLRGKIAPRLQYALWFLVAARLLIPGTLFTVPVSVTGVMDGLSAVLTSTQEETAAVFPAILPPAPANPATAGQAVTENHVQTAAGLSNRTQAINWPSLIWKAGMIITGGAMLLSNLHFSAYLRRKRRIPELPANAETGNLPVYLVDDLPSPCLFGLFGPAIYLNRQALDPAHLSYVLTHERTHFRHGDHLWSILRGVCLTVHWCNPLVWLAASLSRQDCELACDDGVIWLLGEGQRLDYGTALLRMIAPGKPPLLRASTSMTSEKRNMKERISLIIQRPQMLKITLAAVLLVICGAVAVTFGTSARAEEVPEAAAGTAIPLQPRSLTLLESDSYTHFSGLFSLNIPDGWAGRILYEENEDGVRFFDAAAYREAPDKSLLASIYPQAAAWASAYSQESIRLKEFNGSESPYVYLLDWDGLSAPENRSRTQALRDELTGSFQSNVSTDIFSRLVHDTYEDNMPLAIAYLPYLSWDSYRNIYSAEQAQILLTSLTSYIHSGRADWNQYHDIMSNHMDTADTINAKTFTAVVWELYSQNPSQFASVLKSEYLTGGERDHMLSWYCTALAENQDWPEALNFTSEEIYYLLGITHVNSVG